MVTITTSVSGQAAIIKFSAGISPGTPTPLVIYFHGAGEYEDAAFGVSNEKAVTDALIAAGYIVASSAGGGPNPWGNQASQDAYVALHGYIAGIFNLSHVLFIGQSMGGLPSLNLAVANRIPNMRGWYGIYPVTNLNAAYTTHFASLIEAAYGFSGGANYATATSGFDPNARAGTAFPVVRYRMTASYADTVVYRADNSDLLSAKLAPYAVEYSILTASGDHGDSSAFQPSDVLAFFARCAP